MVFFRYDAVPRPKIVDIFLCMCPLAFQFGRVNMLLEPACRLDCGQGLWWCRSSGLAHPVCEPRCHRLWYTRFRSSDVLTLLTLFFCSPSAARALAFSSRAREIRECASGRSSHFPLLYLQPVGSLCAAAGPQPHPLNVWCLC